MSNAVKNSLLGTSALIGATFSYGWFGVLARLVGLDLPLFYQTAIRSLVTSILFLLIISLRHNWKPISTSIWTWAAARSLFGLLGITSFFVSVNFLTIGTVYFIFYAGSTVSGYFIGKLLFSEKLTAVKYLSLVLALAGLGLIYSLNLTGNSFYLLLSLAAGIFTALWNTLHRKLPEDLDPSQVSFMDNILLVAMALPISLLIGEHWLTPTLSTAWLANYGFGFLQVVTGILVVVGFRNLEAQLGSLIMLTEVLFGILLGFLLYQEVINITTLIGGLLILAGIAIPEIYGFRKNHHTPSRG